MPAPLPSYARTACTTASRSRLRRSHTSASDNGSAPATPTLLDRVVGWFAPERALRRVRARAAVLVLREYQGAARSRRTEHWHVGAGTSANTELAAALPTLRDRSRDHVPNNPYGRRAVRHFASSLVGYGMQGTVTGTNKRTVRELQGAWDAWAGARTCDQRGKQTFGGLQRLVARTLLESGEVLARRVWDRDAPFGFRVQVLEPDSSALTKSDPLPLTRSGPREDHDRDGDP